MPSLAVADAVPLPIGDDPGDDTGGDPGDPDGLVTDLR